MIFFKTGSQDNARVFIGLAIMGYDPLYHALQI